MTLPTYTPDRRRALASQLEVDEQYLYQITRGLKIASPSLARRWHEIDKEATLQDLRPDDWQIIWPELAQKTFTRPDGRVVTDERKTIRRVSA